MKKIKEAVAHLLKGGKILIDVASTTVRASRPRGYSDHPTTRQATG